MIALYRRFPRRSSALAAVALIGLTTIAMTDAKAGRTAAETQEAAQFTVDTTADSNDARRGEGEDAAHSGDLDGQGFVVSGDRTRKDRMEAVIDEIYDNLDRIPPQFEEYRDSFRRIYESGNRKVLVDLDGGLITWATGANGWTNFWSSFKRTESTVIIDISTRRRTKRDLRETFMHEFAHIVYGGGHRWHDGGSGHFLPHPAGKGTEYSNFEWLYIEFEACIT